MSKTVAFSYFGTKLIIVVSVITTLALMMLVTVFGITPNEPKKSTDGATTYSAPLTSLASGCGDYFLFEPGKGQYATIPAEVRDSLETIPTHNMTVPVYGYMNTTPLFDEEVRFYAIDELETPLALDKILKTMYDKDITVVWYTADIAPDDYTLLQEYVTAHEDILAVPYNYRNGQLPSDRKVAFSKWGVSQTCEFWTDNTFERFEEFADEHKVAKLSEIPVATVVNGKLVPLAIITN